MVRHSKIRQDTRQNHTKTCKSTTKTDTKAGVSDRADAGPEGGRLRRLDPGTCHKPHQFHILAPLTKTPAPVGNPLRPSTDPEFSERAPFQPFSAQNRHQETPMNRTALAPTPRLWQ